MGDGNLCAGGFKTVWSLDERGRLLRQDPPSDGYAGFMRWDRCNVGWPAVEGFRCAIMPQISKVGEG